MDDVYNLHPLMWFAMDLKMVFVMYMYTFCCMFVYVYGFESLAHVQSYGNCA